jgi:hypothetical protein
MARDELVCPASNPSCQKRTSSGHTIVQERHRTNAFPARSDNVSISIKPLAFPVVSW